MLTILPDSLEEGRQELSSHHSDIVRHVPLQDKYTGPFAEGTDDDKYRGLQVSVMRYETVA